MKLKTRPARMLLCLAALVFASVIALAASKEGTITINGGKQTILMKGKSDSHPAAKLPAKLKTIYSNLGTGSDVYYAGEGWTISGSGSDVDGEYWVAVPFIIPRWCPYCPIKQIDFAAGWLSGTNSVTISLLADSGGLPGKTIYSWTYNNMYTFGDCCYLDTVKSTKGIMVKHGTQYWVAITTNAADASLWGAWNLTYNFATGAFASQINGGGWQPENSYLPAFDVLGQ